MFGALRFPFFQPLLPLLVPLLGLFGCSASQPPTPKPSAPFVTPKITVTPPPAPVEKPGPLLLGIDVLEADGFAAVKGKRLGLLTHPAGVNRRGIPTADILRRAPGVKLVAIFAVEHGING